MINSLKFVLNSLLFSIRIFFLNNTKIKQTTEPSKNIIIYISQWYLTNCYIFSIITSYILLKKGHNIIFVYDDFILSKRNAFKKIFDLFIKINLFLFKNRFKKTKILHLGNFPIKKSTNNLSLSKIKYFYKLNIYRNSRDEQAYKKWNIDKNSNFKKYISYEKKILNFISNYKKSLFFIPGGIANTTCFFNYHLKRLKINYISFDSFNSPNKKYNFLHLCNHGIAAQREDAFQGFKLANKEKIKYKKKRNNLIQKEIYQRMIGKDKLSFQKKVKSNFLKKNFVFIPLGTTWDSSSLGTHHIFKSTSEWLIFTIRWFKKNYPNQVLIIKEHPHLRLKTFTNSETFEKICNRKNVIFVNRFSNLNTYELIKNSKFVISAVSTVAIESAILKKKVILIGKNVFHRFNFSFNPQNKREYLQFLKQNILKKKLANKNVDNAKDCYFFTELLRNINTDVTPATNKIPFLSDKKIESSVTFKILNQIIENDFPVSLAILKSFRN